MINIAVAVNVCETCETTDQHRNRSRRVEPGKLGKQGLQMMTWARLGASLGIIPHTARSAGDTEYFYLIKHITSCNSLQQCTRNGCSTRTSGQTQQFRYSTSQ